MANAADNESRTPSGAQQDKPARPPRAPKAPKQTPAESPAADPKGQKGAPAGKGDRQARPPKAEGQAAPTGEKAQRPPRPQGQQAQAEKGVKGAPAAAPKPAAGKPAMPAGPPRLEVRYKSEIVPVLTREFGYTNPMQVPQVRKVAINIGMGEALKNSGSIDAAVGDITAITGQKPVVTKSRKDIANFGLREGAAIGVMVTLRGARMWQFLDRLLNVALPRVRDFRGIPRNAFDGRGNYALGLKEQVVFPEIDYNKIDRLRGMQINVITSARTDEEGRRLLELLGMPFVRPDQSVAARRN